MMDRYEGEIFEKNIKSVKGVLRQNNQSGL